MMGKSAFLVILGFTLLVSGYQLKLKKAVLDTSDNFNRHFMETLLHETCQSSANIGINKAWSENWNTGSFDLVMNSCSTRVTASLVGLDTIKIKTNAWVTTYDAGTFISKNSSTLLEDSVVAYFSYNTPVSKYFLFVNDINYGYLITGDTMWGPVHSNTMIYTWGTPVFYGKVTAKDGISPDPTTSSAEFNEGWEIGIDASVPTDMTRLSDAAIAGNGGASVNTKSIYNVDTEFEFLNNGNVVRTISGLGTDTVALSDIAPTGVIWSTEEVRLKGTINGQLSIYAERDIYIDDDILYAEDPRDYPASDDMLGIISGEDVFVTDNAANNSDVHIHASVLTPSGSFWAENYATRGLAGTMYRLGSEAQDVAGYTGVFSWSGLISGYQSVGMYDDRLLTTSPPYFPYISELSLVAWWE